MRSHLLSSIAALSGLVPQLALRQGLALPALGSARSFAKAADSGADFIVSPGATDSLFQAASRFDLPFLPGAVTGSEVLMAMDYGYHMLKFFPAEAAGGVPTLRALLGPFPEISFMPTGGITPDNVASYLRLKNVTAVGGSWLTPQQLLIEQRWGELRQVAADSAANVAQIIGGELS